jgi:hypothetical protein
MLGPQVERQLPRMQPVKETDWDYHCALTATDASHLSSSTGVELLPLSVAAGALVPPSLGRLRWSDRVWVTANFQRTVAVSSDAGAGDAALGEYLRPLDAVLLLSGGGGDSNGTGTEHDAVLLSEREAEGVLGAMRAAGRGTSANQLLHLSYAKLAVEQSGNGTHGASLLGGAGSGARSRLSDAQLASMLLFNGESMYGSDGLRGALRPLARRRLAEAEALLGMRGKIALLSRSDLELACD